MDNLSINWLVGWYINVLIACGLWNKLYYTITDFTHPFPSTRAHDLLPMSFVVYLVLW